MDMRWWRGHGHRKNKKRSLCTASDQRSTITLTPGKLHYLPTRSPVTKAITAAYKSPTLQAGCRYSPVVAVVRFRQQPQRPPFAALVSHPPFHLVAAAVVPASRTSLLRCLPPFSPPPNPVNFHRRVLLVFPCASDVERERVRECERE